MLLLCYSFVYIIWEKKFYSKVTHTTQEEAHVLESRVSSDDILSPAVCIQLPLAFACSAAKYCYLRELLCREGRWDSGCQASGLRRTREAGGGLEKIGEDSPQLNPACPTALKIRPTHPQPLSQDNSHFVMLKSACSAGCPLLAGGAGKSTLR